MSLSFPLTLNAKEYPPAPFGLHPAVCVAVSEPEVIENAFGESKAVIRITFEVGELRPDGKRYRLNKTFSASLHPKSSLYQVLDGWLGRCPESFEPSVVLRRRCLLVVSHQTGRDGRTYARIEKIMPSDPNMPLKFDPDS